MKVSEWLEIPPGAGAGLEGTGPIGWASRELVEPKTDRFHHLIIRQYVAEVDDYEFIESNNFGLFPKGIRHGYLIEEYGGSDIEVYVVDCPEEMAKLAPLELIHYGKVAYDFITTSRFIAQLPRVLCKMVVSEHRIRKLRPSDFNYKPDRVFQCIEALWTAYASVGVPLFPPGWAPLPAAIRQSILDGLIKVYWKGVLPRKTDEGLVGYAVCHFFSQQTP